MDENTNETSMPSMGDMIAMTAGFVAKAATNGTVQALVKTYQPLPLNRVQAIGFAIGTACIGSMAGKAAGNHVYSKTQETLGWVKKISTDLQEMVNDKDEPKTD